MKNTAALAIAGVAAAVGFIAALVFGVNAMCRHGDETRCAGFGIASGREVKFVSYSNWSWGCLTPGSDGKWIDTANLREVG